MNAVKIAETIERIRIARDRRAWQRLRDERLRIEAAPPAWAEGLEARRARYERAREAERRAGRVLSRRIEGIRSPVLRQPGARAE